jgi:hypothetical protein
VITSSFHMPRSKVIFSHLLSLADITPGIHVTFEEAEDFGIDKGALESRIEKEKRSLKDFCENKIPLLTTLLDTHRFLFHHHSAYATADPAIEVKKDTLTGSAKLTY